MRQLRVVGWTRITLDCSLLPQAINLIVIDRESINFFWTTRTSLKQDACQQRNDAYLSSGLYSRLSPQVVIMASAVTLAEDQIDDLIYVCRAGDLTELQESIATLSSTLNTSASAVISSAIDVDSEGLGARTCLLHYPAANGNLEIITYLLAQLEPHATSTTNGVNESPAAPVNGASQQGSGQTLVNHQNVSGNTPLHWAALNGHLEIVKALVNAGADPTIVNEAGRDAVVEAEYSAKETAAACADWLLKSCEGLERGPAGIHEAEAETEADMEDDVVDGSSNEQAVEHE